jgi:hypothetical protein
MMMIMITGMMGRRDGHSVLGAAQPGCPWSSPAPAALVLLQAPPRPLRAGPGPAWPGPGRHWRRQPEDKCNNIMISRVQFESPSHSRDQQTIA